MRALLPRAAFRSSLALFHKRPWATLMLGLALLTSLGAVCCGLGVVVAPWFLCELFALQIALGTDRSPPRTSAWLWAGAVQMIAVVVLGAIAALSLLAVGPDVVIGGVAQGTQSAQQRLGESLAVLLVVGGLALVLVVPFEHAPAILIDRGGGLTAALLESARLVAETGPLRTWLTSAAAHGLQVVPAVAAVAIAAGTATLKGTVLWGIVLLPAFAACLALGQGMVVASYLCVRDAVTAPESVPPEAAPSKSGTLVWSLLLICVIAGPLLVSGALLKPAEPGASALPPDATIVLAIDPAPTARELYLPDTALSLRVDAHSLRVVASDGGGAGLIPLPPGRLAAVRAARGEALPPGVEASGLADSVFAIEASLADGRRFTTWVDDAGVRLDDSLTRRLSNRLPAWATWMLAACLAWTGIWIARALPPQARIRRELAEKHRVGFDAEHRERLKAALRGRALHAAVWLVPAALSSLGIGLWAALG